LPDTKNVTPDDEKYIETLLGRRDSSRKKLLLSPTIRSQKEQRGFVVDDDSGMFAFLPLSIVKFADIVYRYTSTISLMASVKGIRELVWLGILSSQILLALPHPKCGRRPTYHHLQLSPNVADEDPERMRYVRHRLTRLGNAALDRRDALMRRLVIHGDDHTFTRRRAFTRSMDTIVSENDEETETRLRERWRFDQDDEPTVGPEGADELRARLCPDR